MYSLLSYSTTFLVFPHQFLQLIHYVIVSKCKELKKGNKRKRRGQAQLSKKKNIFLPQ